MASKLSMAGCDSASSLPMQSKACMQPAAPQQQQQQQGSAAAAAAGIDPAKLHNWEPQTSLLDLRTNSSVHGSTGPGTFTPPAASNASGSQQNAPHDSMSWGTQSAGGGLWLGGEFAPSNMPSDVQLPPVPHGDEAVPAMPGLQEALAAAAAAQQHQQQQQQLQLLQHQQGLQGQGHVVHWPGLAGPAAALQQQQQQQQQQPGQVLQLRSLDDRSSTDPDAAANTQSSSGVYIENNSTMTEELYEAGSPSQASLSPVPAGVSGHSRPLVQASSSMAPIAEEAEQQAAGTAAAAAGTAAGVAASTST
jgi:hypothetical protein